MKLDSGYWFTSCPPVFLTGNKAFSDPASGSGSNLCDEDDTTAPAVTIEQPVDGQTITGFLSDQDENVIVLRPIGGQKIVLDRERIQSMENAGVSLMPQGLLAGLENKEIIDFFAYLRSTQPLNIKK